MRKTKKIIVSLLLFFILLIGTAISYASSAASHKNKRENTTISANTAKKKNKKKFYHLNYSYYFKPVGVDGHGDIAKFNEYQDIKSGVSGGLSVDYLNGANYFRLMGKEIGLDTTKVKLQTGMYGDYSVTAEFDEIPHNYAFGVNTLYSGIGSNTLYFSPNVQNALAGNKKPPTVSAMESFLDNPDNLTNFDEAIYRNNYKVGASYTPQNNLTLATSVTWDHETGEQPYFANLPSPPSPGFDSVELAEPIDYDTLNGNFQAQYLAKPFYVTAQFSQSSFTDNNTQLIFANPFYYLNSAIPSEGALSLPPSNQAENFSFSGAVFSLPWQGRLTLSGEWGSEWQDQALLPYTINSSLIGINFNGTPFNASNPANLPVSSCDCAASTLFYNAFYTASPLSFLHLRAHYNEFSYDNTTPVINFPGYVNYDSAWVPGSNPNSPYSYRDYTTSGEAAFDLYRNTTFTASFQNKISDLTDLEASHLNENKYEFALDSSDITDWLNFHIDYSTGNRTGNFNLFSATGPTGGLVDTSLFPYSVYFFEENRYDDKWHWLLNFTPTNSANFTVDIINEKDIYNNPVSGTNPNYPASILVQNFGLQGDNHSSYTLDGDFRLTRKNRLSLFFSKADYQYNQLSRQWTPFSASNPYTGKFPGFFSYDNWTALTNDRSYTYGGNFTSHINKAQALKLNYTNSQNWGSILPIDPVGPAALDSTPYPFLPFANNNDTSKDQTFNLRYLYTFDKGGKILTIGYENESLWINDYDLAGEVLVYPVTPTPAAAAASGLWMDTLPGNYSVNVYYASIKFKF